MSEVVSQIGMGAFMGLLAGLAVACGGAIKDAPMEGFKPLTFMRSPLIGMAEGAMIGGVFHKAKLHPAILFLSTIGTERITVEGYKLIRAKIPGKFEYGEWGRKLN